MHQYAGLIYDGAYSEGLENPDIVGLVGDEIDQNKAQEIAKAFLGEDRISEMNFSEESQNANINCYNFNGKTKSGDNFIIGPFKFKCSENLTYECTVKANDTDKTEITGFAICKQNGEENKLES